MSKDHLAVSCGIVPDRAVLPQFLSFASELKVSALRDHLQIGATVVEPVLVPVVDARVRACILRELVPHHEPVHHHGLTRN
jgi:hypothetical protein